MGSSLVLVIEDHLLRRMNAAEVLREAGYDVIEASDAAVATAAPEDRSGVRPCGAEVQMSKVRDGVDLALLIRRVYPHIAHSGTDQLCAGGAASAAPDSLRQLGGGPGLST
jgi:CheY-like chemotaxis protein